MVDQNKFGDGVGEPTLWVALLLHVIGALVRQLGGGGINLCPSGGKQSFTKNLFLSV